MTEPRIIPADFLRWGYEERAALIRRQAEGEKVPSHEVFLGFTRHNPAIASIKGVGFVPKPEYLQETLDAYMEHIQRGVREGYSQEGLQLLMKVLYGPECAERIDFTRLGSLELARRHSWDNLQVNPEATLLFFQPPMVSYEVRTHVEIHEQGSPYHLLLNAQHDVYHHPHPETWAEKPAYIFIIDEIYDNSVTKAGFGQQIY
jgi:hypothetical protein